MHIAIATIYKVDILVSWNFKHIVNLNRIKKYNAVNLKYGYSIRNKKSKRNLKRLKNMKKDFDAVDMMRSIREKLQKEYEIDPGLRKKRLEKIRQRYGLCKDKEKTNQ